MPRKRSLRKRFPVPSCRRGDRHWFTYHGDPLSFAPVCQHCGVPNPYGRLDDYGQLSQLERERFAAAMGELGLDPAYLLESPGPRRGFGSGVPKGYYDGKGKVVS